MLGVLIPMTLPVASSSGPPSPPTGSVIDVHVPEADAVDGLLVLGLHVTDGEGRLARGTVAGKRDDRLAGARLAGGRVERTMAAIGLVDRKRDQVQQGIRRDGLRRQPAPVQQPDLEALAEAPRRGPTARVWVRLQSDAGCLIGR